MFALMLALQILGPLPAPPVKPPRPALGCAADEVPQVVRLPDGSVRVFSCLWPKDVRGN